MKVWMKWEERENISNIGLLRKAPCERYTVKQSETRVCTENFNPDKFQEIILDLFHAGKKPVQREAERDGCRREDILSMVYTILRWWYFTMSVYRWNTWRDFCESLTRENTKHQKGMSSLLSHLHRILLVYYHRPLVYLQYSTWQALILYLSCNYSCLPMPLGGRRLAQSTWDNLFISS